MPEMAKKLHWTQTPEGKKKLSEQGKRTIGTKLHKMQAAKRKIENKTIFSEYEDLISRVDARIAEINKVIVDLELERKQLEELSSPRHGFIPESGREYNQE